MKTLSLKPEERLRRILERAGMGKFAREASDAQLKELIAPVADNDRLREGVKDEEGKP